MKRRCIYVGEPKGTLNYGVTGEAHKEPDGFWVFLPDGNTGYPLLVFRWELHFPHDLC